MPKFAANLTMMYNEYPFLERFGAAARDGFDAVEFLFPYSVPPQELRARLDDNGLTQVLFNCPPGNWDAGERGLAALPGRENEFKHSIESALHYAQVIGNKRLHVMAGLLEPACERDAQRAVYLENLAYAAEQAAAHEIVVLIEPINTRDMPGYLLNRQDEAQQICEEVGASNLMVQFDIYHCQIVEGDVATKLKRDFDGIGHIQIAGVPMRNEPDGGEVNYPYLLQLLDELQYEGWVGCEYRPRGSTSAGLHWLQPWRKQSTSATMKVTL